MKAILGILGATGVGKSQVAVEVAKILQSAVISCDSLQVYQHLDIATAKISKQQMQGVKHYMLDVVSPKQSFSAFDFQDMVCKDILPIFQDTNTVPIVAGGTGLYFESLIYGLDFQSAQDNQLRMQLNSLYQEKGIDSLLELLKQCDAVSYEKIDKKNARRIIRAIEIAQNGDSVYRQQSNRMARFKSYAFLLQCDREKMYQNINNRVDEMVENGLFEEVENVLKMCDGDSGLQCFQAIGCKEVVDYLQNRLTKSQAISAIKQNTRRYAKRQVTFFKRIDAEQVNVSDFQNANDIAEYIVEKYLKKQ